MDRRERRARRLERRLEAAQVGVEETEEMGVVQAATKLDAAEETVRAAGRVKTLEERRAARRERALKLAEHGVVSEEPKHLEVGTLEVEEALVETAAALDEVVVEQPKLPGSVSAIPANAYALKADSVGDSLNYLLDRLAELGAIHVSKVADGWVISKMIELSQLETRLDAPVVKVGKASNKRTPHGYKEQDFYTPEYAEFKARWAKMTLDEKVAEAQAAGATWTECDDPKIRNMRVMMAVLGHEGIVKWKPGFETDAKRRASVSD